MIKSWFIAANFKLSSVNMIINRVRIEKLVKLTIFQDAKFAISVGVGNVVWPSFLFDFGEAESSYCDVKLSNKFDKRRRMGRLACESSMISDFNAAAFW